MTFELLDITHPTYTELADILAQGRDYTLGRGGLPDFEGAIIDVDGCPQIRVAIDNNGFPYWSQSLGIPSPGWLATSSHWLMAQLPPPTPEQVPYIARPIKMPTSIWAYIDLRCQDTGMSLDEYLLDVIYTDMAQPGGS